MAIYLKSALCHQYFDFDVECGLVTLVIRIDNLNRSAGLAMIASETIIDTAFPLLLPSAPLARPK